jgi:hypothetical protein
MDLMDQMDTMDRLGVHSVHGVHFAAAGALRIWEFHPEAICWKIKTGAMF